jgi:hypothetical protein
MGKKKGARGPCGGMAKHVESQDDMAARDALLSKSGADATESAGDEGSDYNSDLDLDFEGTADQADGDDLAAKIERIKLGAFEKDQPLDVKQLIEVDNPNTKVDFRRPIKASDIDMDAVGDESLLSGKERKAREARRAEEELFRMIEAGETVESQKDLARLEDIREERERAKARREYEAKKKEKLRAAAAERAKELEDKQKKKAAGGGGKKKGKGKKR